MLDQTMTKRYPLIVMNTRPALELSRDGGANSTQTRVVRAVQ